MPSTHRKRPARQRLLTAASRLFYTRGITATGIDSITAHAGVAKMSLYNNFSSKEDLTLAYLDNRHQELLGFYRQRLTQTEDTSQRTLAMFDAYIDHASMNYDGGFRGCGLLNAAAELPGGHSGREAVRAHKQEIESLLRVELYNAGYDESAAKATHLALLLEGAMTRAGLEGTTTYLHQARHIAQQLLEVR